MGKKLMEQTAAEMAAHLVELAGPVKRLLDDDEIKDTWRECTKKGVRNKLDSILTIYTEMAPLLFGDKHIRDLMHILAAVEGKNVDELLKMNGAELLSDSLVAWEEQIKPFFSLLGLTVSGM